jgi:uncharacterized membrane protein
MLKRLKDMLLDFLLIMAGILLCTTVFCTIFNREIRFGVDLLWQIIGLAFFSTLPGFIFFSKHELTKKQMLTRQIIHACILVILLLFFAYHWRWLIPQSIVQPIVFIFMIAFVYMIVSFFTYKRDKKVANMLNEQLKKFKQKNTD